MRPSSVFRQQRKQSHGPNRTVINPAVGRCGCKSTVIAFHSNTKSVSPSGYLRCRFSLHSVITIDGSSSSINKYGNSLIRFTEAKRFAHRCRCRRRGPALKAEQKYGPTLYTLDSAITITLELTVPQCSRRCREANPIIIRFFPRIPHRGATAAETPLTRRPKKLKHNLNFVIGLSFSRYPAVAEEAPCRSRVARFHTQFDSP